LPAARAAVLKDATPLPLSVIVASTVLPFWKATVPVGIPAPGATAATVAVKVTDCPGFDGFGPEASPVVVEALVIVCVAALPLLFAHPEAPVKVAVMVWLPLLSDAMLNEAWPDPFTGTFDARTVVPSVNVTVPVGTPALEVVVEVKVTGCPMAEGFGAEVTVVDVALASDCCTRLPLLAAKFVSEA
jgi:hypothetical protein